MNRHAKASSGGTTHRRIGGIGRLPRLLTALTAIAALLALAAGTASASVAHPFLETFGSAEQPSFREATNVAVDQSSGDLLVLSQENNSRVRPEGGIFRFKPDGTPDDFSALGASLINKTPESWLEFARSPARTRSSVQVAVDNSGTATQGDIYVATGTAEGSRVAIFSPTGAFLGQLTEYKEGPGASGPAVPFAERACGVAVDSNGNVYVGDGGGYVHKYVPSSNPPTVADNTANFIYPEACNLAAGAGPTAGFIFVNSFNEGAGELSKLDSSSGEVKYTVDTGVTTVSVDPSSGHVYAVIGSSIVELDASGAGSATTVSSTPLEGIGGGVAVRGSTGNVYLTREGEPHLEVLGPAGPAAAVTTEAASEITGTSARLNGTINPEGTAISECRFLYGVAPGDFSNSVPCEGSVPTDSSAHAVSAKITGLPGDGSSFVYRLVGVNATGKWRGSPSSFAIDTTATTEAATAVTQATATLNGSVKTDGEALSDCRFEYGSDDSFGQSAPCTPAAGSIPLDFADHPVSADLSGLQEGATYYFRVSTTDAGGTVQAKPLSFTTPGMPTVDREGAIASQTAAAIGGYVDPNGSETTTYRFEWGTSTAYGNTAPAGPEPSAGSGNDPVPVAARLNGLTLGTTYHFRLVATNSLGTARGLDQEFTTYKIAQLRDGRRYEQVSPVDKNHSNVEAELSVASVDGDGLVFRSFGSFAGATNAQSILGMQYRATRGPAGWSTESIAPPGAELGTSGYVAFSSDLAKGVVFWPEFSVQEGTIDPNAQSGYNLYLHDMADGSFTLLNGTLEAVGFLQGSRAVPWASPDLSHVAISTHNPLTADTPSVACGDQALGRYDEQNCAYEWNEGVLRLASILPSGRRVGGTPGSAGIGLGSAIRPCSAQHAISDDGSRLFFTSPSDPSQKVESRATGRREVGRLYARENGTATTLISASERTLPGGASDWIVNYQDAEAAHGGRVLFTTRNSLVNEDEDDTNDLYLYDYAKPAGERLTLISKDHNPGGPEGAAVDDAEQSTERCGGVMGASEDLRRVYFVADNQIVPGEPEGEGPKLYLWDDTGAGPEVTYVGTLDAGDQRDWQGAVAYWVNRDARTSRDGRYLAFFSTARLTSFANEGRKELYRYDAATHAIECASCSADASPSSGEISFGRQLQGDLSTFVWNRVSTNLSDNGQVFFQTTRGLVPQDANGKTDVYEYEDGRLSLISSGVGSGDSYFLDASPSGSDVFFTTSDRLVGWDKDENLDAYDAREGGGFPEPPLSPPPCEGDACQPAPNPPNDPTPASSSFEGAGNVSEPKASRCSKGKVHRHGRCVKRRRHAKKHTHRKTTTRSHG